MSGRLFSPSGHELVPIPGGGGLVKDTVTGNIFTPGGGFGGATTLPNAAVKTAPLPEVPKAIDPSADFSITNRPPPLPEPPIPPDKVPATPKSAADAQPDKDQPRREYPETEGDELWLRRWKLSIGTQSGSDALDLSELAFQFRVDQSKWMIPWQGQFTIYNVGEDILSRMQKELTTVYLEAGYRNSAQYGKLFAGPIAFYRHGRLNATDTFVEIHAIQWDQPISGALINSWQPAGYTKADVVYACLAAMAPYGITAGQITDLGDAKSPRSRVLHGMASDVLRDVAHSADAEVWIDGDGKLHLLGKDEALKKQMDTVPILNSQSGMIDVPTSTLGGGVEVRSLLNPKLIPGGQVKINQRDITQYQMVSEGAFPDPNQAMQLRNTELGVHTDGYYVVVNVQHFGENRGNPWYSDIKTMPYDQTQAGVGIAGRI